ncbi:SGM_5486 family transporter-associated protein [Streptomyces sp. NPDC003697]
MPVLEPNPRNGQKKMLIVFGAFFAIFAVIAVVATLVAP